MKWIAPILVYLAVGFGLFILHSAWGTLLCFHLVIIVSLLLAKPTLPISFLLKSHNPKLIILSVLLCGSSGSTLYFIWNHFGIVNDIGPQTESFGLNVHTWLPFIAYFTLINPLIEEYFWRGYLGSPTKSLHISDFLYAGFHGLILLYKTPINSILFALSALVLAGWFWRQIQREDQGLLAPVLGHMAADFTILFAIFLKVS